MTRRNADTVARLLDWCRERGSLAPGSERKTVLDIDADLELEVHIKVRRRVGVDKVAAYRAGALAALDREPWRVEHCGAYLKRKRAPWSKYNPPCDGKVLAALAYSGKWHPDPAAPTPSYLFVCHRHRETNGIDPPAVLALVELPARSLDELRKRAEEDRRKLWAEDEKRRQAEQGRGIVVNPPPASER